MGRAGGEGLIGRVGLRERIGGIVTDEGVNVAIHTLDLVQAGLGGVARGDFASGEFGRQFGNGELVQHEHSAVCNWATALEESG